MCQSGLMYLFAKEAGALYPLEGSNPSISARNRNRILKPNRGRHEVPTQMYSPQKILNLKGFATLRVAPRLPIQL